jgi:hypothetical protein
MSTRKTFRTSASLVVLALAAAGCQSMRSGDAKMADGATAEAKMQSARTGKFEGAKANAGYATLTKRDGKLMLTWSDDFKIPDTPAPHWQVVDSKGNVYLLQRLVIKEDKQNRTIVLPSYVRDVQTVQIWCAWAEALLGEASFPKPMTAASMDDASLGS